MKVHRPQFKPKLKQQLQRGTNLGPWKEERDKKPKNDTAKYNGEE